MEINTRSVLYHVPPMTHTAIINNIASFGRYGSKVEGSRFVRSYCYSCGEPIRVCKPGKPKFLNEAETDMNEGAAYIHGRSHCLRCIAAMHTGYNFVGHHHPDEGDESWDNVVKVREMAID